MKQPHAIVADDIRNVGFEYARCARDVIKFTDAGASTHFRRGGRPTLCRRLENDLSIRDDRWSESIALGNLAFIDEVRSGLGFKAAHRDIVNFVEVMRCGSPAEEYALKFAAETEALRSQNTFVGKESFDEATT